MSVLAVIPARYASSRFPGKALARIAGKPMVQHVWERTMRAGSVDEVVVATDDERIFDVCRSLKIDVTMTAASHPSGTDRLFEVASKRAADIYVNVQGDEPMISPAAIDHVVTCLQDAIEHGIDVATAYNRGATAEQEASTSSVHLVPTLAGTILTLSRLPVPCAFKAEYRRNIHVGLYAFTGAALSRFAARAVGPVEQSESIELMRFLEYGDRVACVAVAGHSIGVDHSSDIALVEASIAREKAGGP
jgi:3-deoxy-manno-octulosonate cytidylyltransferase (CMP-KDO synthetase)